MLLAIVLSILAAATPTAPPVVQPDASITVGTSTLLIFQGAYIPLPPEVVTTVLEAVQDSQSIATVVQDPVNPDEPWTVTTFRREGESYQSVLRRHFELVLAVRNSIRGRGP